MNTTRKSDENKDRTIRVGGNTEKELESVYLLLESEVRRPRVWESSKGSEGKCGDSHKQHFHV